MPLINKFKNGESPKVVSSSKIIDIISKIKEGDENLQEIKELREIGKSNPLFDKMKMKLFPSYRFNFTFNLTAANKNIIEPTGFIYIDVDKQITVDKSNPLIYACWKSISGTGYGILVKVDNLTLDNFKDTYHSIGNQLGINPDLYACKATQQTIQSFDPELYLNEDSLTFNSIHNKGNPTIVKVSREKATITNPISYGNNKLRFNNIGDYFEGNESKDFLVFGKEKIKICAPFIPQFIEKGKRNSTMFLLLSQYIQLNQFAAESFLIACANTINKSMVPCLTTTEIKKIINSVLKKNDEATLTLILNKERRILFNPSIELTTKEKQKIVGQEMGKLKTEKTLSEIYKVVEGWDFDNLGKITQDKIATQLSKGVKTIKRNWAAFKSYVGDLNDDYKKTNSVTKIKLPVVTSSNPTLEVLEVKISA